jgi:hypothetical protein
VFEVGARVDVSENAGIVHVADEPIVVVRSQNG